MRTPWQPNVDPCPSTRDQAFLLVIIRRPTVAIVTPYFAPRIGGMETYALNVARALQQSADLDVVVVTSQDRGARPGVEHYEGLTVVRLRRWFRLSNSPVSPVWLWTVWRLLRRYEVDLVNTHSPVPFLADVAVMVAGRRPVVMTYHAGSMRKGKQPVDLIIHVYERHVLPRLFKRANTIVSVSPGLLSGILASWRQKVDLITPGVDVERFTPVDASVASGAGTPVITYVGRIDRS